MKSFFTCLLAIAAICLVGACDSHPFSETKALHEKYQEHGGHSEGHAEGASHEAAPAHAEAK